MAQDFWAASGLRLLGRHADGGLVATDAWLAGFLEREELTPTCRRRVVKASLVALFFMQLRYDKFNAVIFLGGVLFLAIFLIWTLFDFSPGQRCSPATSRNL